MDEFRLMMWLNGDLHDNELTWEEIEWLQLAVMHAVAQKLGAAEEPVLVH